MYRGYDVAQILLFHNSTFENESAIIRNIPKNIKVNVIPSPPNQAIGTNDEEAMMKYFHYVDPTVTTIWKDLLNIHQTRVDNLTSMSNRSKSVLWWPFTQHKNISSISVIDSAFGEDISSLELRNSNSLGLHEASLKKDNLVDKSSNPLSKESSLLNSFYDSSASWWTQGTVL